MPESGDDRLHAAAPAYDDVEAQRARAGVAAALFGGLAGADADDPGSPTPERVAVGRYEIQSRLGAGGMGVVYRAHDPDLDRPVAVKLLHVDTARDDKARARMLREARALAKLSHPNVITVYDVGTDEGRVFVAMELVAGLDLRRWLEHHRDAAWDRVVALFIAAGRGLAAAHELALIHRDFKPENVLVGDDGRVRVLDFGLARLQPSRPIHPATDADGPGIASEDPTERGGGDRGAVVDLRRTAAGLTETGAMLGTPLYMAPELYAGKPADERSDQFAFCVSLYEGLYRQPPFGARTLAAHVEAVKAGRVVEPPSDGPVPADVWALIQRGLDPDPEARHADMNHVLAALEDLVQPNSASASASLATGPSGTRWSAIGLLVAVAVVFAVVGLLGAQQGWLSPAASGPTPEPIEVPVDSTPAPTPSAATPEPLTATDTSTSTDSSPDTSTDTSTDSSRDPGTDSIPGPGDTGGAEAVVEPLVAAKPSAEFHDWCHLHEDQFTLLQRGAARRSNFVHRGQCYACRVERRASRTRSFSPRDCAGYSLCGPTAAGDCP